MVQFWDSNYIHSIIMTKLDVEHHYEDGFAALHMSQQRLLTR